MEALGLSGFDPSYRVAHVPTGAAEYGIAEDEFVRRTLLVGERCISKTATPQQIVTCYRRVLRAGE